MHNSMSRKLIFFHNVRIYDHIKKKITTYRSQTLTANHSWHEIYAGFKLILTRFNWLTMCECTFIQYIYKRVYCCAPLFRHSEKKKNHIVVYSNYIPYEISFIVNKEYIYLKWNAIQKNWLHCTKTSLQSLGGHYFEFVAESRADTETSACKFFNVSFVFFFFMSFERETHSNSNHIITYSYEYVNYSSKMHCWII